MLCKETKVAFREQLSLLHFLSEFTSDAILFKHILFKISQITLIHMVEYVNEEKDKNGSRAYIVLLLDRSELCCFGGL